MRENVCLMRFLSKKEMFLWDPGDVYLSQVLVSRGRQKNIIRFCLEYCDV